MAIVAVAAIAGGAAAAATSVAVVAAVAAVVTVVGYVTESKTLMKIGAGLGMGGAVAGAAGWSGALSGAAESAGATGAAEVGSAAGTAEAGTAAGGVDVASNATGMATNSTGTTLRAAEGAAGIGYGGEGIATTAPVASGALRGTDVSAAAPNATPSGIIDAAAETSTMASPAEMAQIPGMATNSTGTTLRAMEGGSNAVYGGSQASGGSSYWDSLGDFWKGLDSGDKQIVGGIIKGVGQGAASYMGESMKQKAQIDAENRLRNNRSNFTPVRWSTK